VAVVGGKAGNFFAEEPRQSKEKRNSVRGSLYKGETQPLNGRLSGAIVKGSLQSADAAGAATRRQVQGRPSEKAADAVRRVRNASESEAGTGNLLLTRARRKEMLAGKRKKRKEWV